MDNGFDPASSKRMREGEGEGHGMAYVHRRLLDEKNPIPIVPVFLNTYFPPNQPRPRRCYELGPGEIRKAVAERCGRRARRRHRWSGLSQISGRRGFRPSHPQGLRRQGRKIPAKPAAQQAAFRQLRDSQLGRCRRRLRASRSELVRICAGLSHAGRHRHRLEFRELGVAAATRLVRSR